MTTDSSNTTTLISSTNTTTTSGNTNTNTNTLATNHKGKTRYQYFCNMFRIRCIRYSSRYAVVLMVSIFVLVYIGHRIASHYMNNRTWYKAPINFIDRQCPKPKYSTRKDTSGSSSSSSSSDNNDNSGADTSTSTTSTIVTTTTKEDSAKTSTAKDFILEDSTVIKYIPGKICLTTLTDAKKADFTQRLLRWRNFDNLLEMTWPNKRNYAAKQGYHLFDESDVLDQTRPPSWSKIVAVQRLLTKEQCEWVFWMDADTVVMNSNIRIDDFLPIEQHKDLLLTEQKGGSYNAGAWIIRNTPWSHKFLHTWWNKSDFVQPKGLSVSGDNDALKDYILNEMPNEEFQQHVVVPPRCTFNSVTKFLTPEERQLYERDMNMLSQQFWYMHTEYYHHGDFIAHVAGRNNKITTTAMLLHDAV